MITVVHFVNQFFAGLGGEDKAGISVAASDGAAGAARGLQLQLGSNAEIACTISCGDNYFHEHKESAIKAAVEAAAARRPRVFVAGPAFNSGRYGVACVEICRAMATTLGISCVTAMHEENPAVKTYREFADPRVYCLPTAETAAGMAAALRALAQFALRLGRGESIGAARHEGYMPRGIRRLETADRSGARRAVDMLLNKIAGEPFDTEIPMESWDSVTPAPPLRRLSEHNIALVTTSGVVPWGNPDGFKTYRNSYWKKYSIAELSELEPGKWEAIHGGYNVVYMNRNPHYGVPLDALRALEADGVIGRGKLYPAYYVIPGNQGSPAVMSRVGQEIATDLKANGVQGVLLVAT